MPVRLEIGPRDLAAGQVMLARRLGGKAPTPMQGIVAAVSTALDDIQKALFDAVFARRAEVSSRQRMDALDRYDARTKGRPTVEGALAGLVPGDEVVVVTWLHLGDRSTLAVHPRSDTSRPLTGDTGRQRSLT